MSLISKSENSITYEDDLILFNGMILIERYPQDDVEFISMSDGSLIRFKNEKFEVCRQGPAILSKSKKEEKLLIDPDQIEWVVFGEIDWVS